MEAPSLEIEPFARFCYTYGNIFKLGTLPMNLRRAVVWAKILWPFPLYLTAKSAGNLMVSRFSDSVAMQYAAPGENVRWQYYVGFIAQQSGFWFPQAVGGDKFVYRFKRAPASMGEESKEHPDWYPPVLIGRLSLWTAIKNMRKLDESMPEPYAYRAKGHKPTRWQKFRTGLANLFLMSPAGLVAPYPQKIDVDAIIARERAEATGNWIPADPNEPSFEMLPLPPIDLTLKPADVEYNWKSTMPMRQARYKEAGWSAVDPKRHPELAEYKVGKRIIWQGIVLMECDRATVKEWQKRDYELAKSREHAALKSGEWPVVDQFEIRGNRRADSK
jgi:hypothetical protein